MTLYKYHISLQKKHDIEIAGFFVAILAWGTRKSIITSANRLMKLFEYSPYDFILNHQIDDTKNLKTLQASNLPTYRSAVFYHIAETYL